VRASFCATILPRQFDFAAPQQESSGYRVGLPAHFSMHGQPLSNRLCENPRMNDENDEINDQESPPTNNYPPIGHPLDPQADEVACGAVLRRLGGGSAN